MRNPDGSVSLLVEYFNRNKKKRSTSRSVRTIGSSPAAPIVVDPPLSAPSPVGVFTITVPADFGDKKLTWTIVANGKTTSVPMGLHRDYEVEPFEAADGQHATGLAVRDQGPGIARTSARLRGVPDHDLCELAAHGVGHRRSAHRTRRRRARSNAPPVSITWSLYRRPAAVTFDQAKPKWIRPTARLSQRPHSTARVTTSCERRSTTPPVTAAAAFEVLLDDGAGQGDGEINSNSIHGL